MECVKFVCVLQVSADYVVPHLTVKTVVGLTQNPKVRSSISAMRHIPATAFATSAQRVMVSLHLNGTCLVTAGRSVCEALAGS